MTPTVYLLFIFKWMTKYNIELFLTNNYNYLQKTSYEQLNKQNIDNYYTKYTKKKVVCEKRLTITYIV